jgi:regulator of sigma D
MDFNDIKNKLVDEKDKVEQGLDKVGDAVKAKFGHDDQVDKGVAKANDYLDQQAAERNNGPAEPTV